MLHSPRETNKEMLADTSYSTEVPSLRVAQGSQKPLGLVETILKLLCIQKASFLQDAHFLNRIHSSENTICTSISHHQDITVLCFLVRLKYLQYNRQIQLSHHSILFNSSISSFPNNFAFIYHHFLQIMCTAIGTKGVGTNNT